MGTNVLVSPLTGKRHQLAVDNAKWRTDQH